MRALALTSFDAPPTLHDDLPDPTPGAGEVLVSVHASSVNPVDNGIAAGMMRGMAEYDFPVILGRDYAGVVEQTGPGATRFAVGDAVFGYLPHANPTVRAGSWAELTTADETQVAALPPGVDTAAAGATPLAGITALFTVDALSLEEGQSVLIIGASGGVGSFAVQLAAHAGAHVVATALPDDHDYLRSLGASELVDRNSDVAASVRQNHPDGVDALIDLVSFTTDAFAAYAAALKEGGHTASPLPGIGEGAGRFPIMATPDPSALARLAEHLADTTLRVPIHHRYHLEQAGDALNALPTTHTQGKLGITIR
jgi:NADPH:quinone reductase-like Zn-dependent oxidoreductase